ncbi:MAG: MBL fold metallo-hydrolase [Alphaproteobacteria bacterium]|nr:MBL fold metallo-hydrolase [Alphaproteobacteria bacterium]
MTLQLADRWFERRRIDDDITLLWEPFVDPLGRCNIWHVRGRERDLLVDSGMGIASLRDAAADLFEGSLVAVATHSHFDHVGSMHEFPDRVIHRLEADLLAAPGDDRSLKVADIDKDFRDYLAEVGYPLDSEWLITALPTADYDPAAWTTPPAPATRTVDDGDVVDLGDRSFEVLHLPGHSPGSMGLWEAATGTLFSGDAVYDGPLLDRLPESDIAAYMTTMHRLRELPVTVVHAGHDPSFGRTRLAEIADRFIAHGGYVPEA